jgi:hypothetical protein
MSKTIWRAGFMFVMKPTDDLGDDGEDAHGPGVAGRIVALGIDDVHTGLELPLGLAGPADEAKDLDPQQVAQLRSKGVLGHFGARSLGARARRGFLAVGRVVNSRRAGAVQSPS